MEVKSGRSYSGGDFPGSWHTGCRVDWLSAEDLRENQTSGGPCRRATAACRDGLTGSPGPAGLPRLDWVFWSLSSEWETFHPLRFLTR